jgi:hypothetical protein
MGAGTGYRGHLRTCVASCTSYAWRVAASARSKPLMPQLRRARRWEEVIRALAARDASITSRSHVLLQGSAALSTVINARKRTVQSS